MKITEIVLTPSRADALEKYQGNFSNQDRTPAFNNLGFSQVQTADSHELGLFSRDNLVAYLRLDQREDPTWQITLSQTQEQYQDQGCFRYLLLKAVSSHGEVLSDTHQTAEAKAAWQSLIRYPGGLMQILSVDTETNTVYPTWNVPEDEIWNQETSPVLLARKQQYSEKILESMKKRDAWHHVNNTGRDHDSIWFGPDSSNSEYINP
jgi:hypothetical protein